MSRLSTKITQLSKELGSSHLNYRIIYLTPYTYTEDPSYLFFNTQTLNNWLDALN